MRFGIETALPSLRCFPDPDPADSSYTVDYAYLLRDADGTVRVERDRHIEGLFARGDWLRLMADAGFQPRAVRFEHSELEPGQYEVFVGRKPAEIRRPGDQEGGRLS